jgi:hypothetical protein
MKTAFLTVRMTDLERTQFLLKASEYGRPSTILREIIQAFIEDRLSISKPVNRKEIYNVD